MAKKKRSPKADATCSKGGTHEWEEADGGTFCAKCHEAKPAKGRRSGSAPKEKQSRKPRSKSDGKLSAIDAAAKVLGEADAPMNTKGMVEAMSAKGYWTSPGGKTPWATLYTAILAEITKKGPESRFKKIERGQFTLNA
jgi:hypothetical protein